MRNLFLKISAFVKKYSCQSYQDTIVLVICSNLFQVKDTCYMFWKYWTTFDQKYGKWQIELKIAIIVIVPHNIFKPNIIYIYIYGGIYIFI